MWVALLLVALILLALMIYLATLEGRFHVSRSLEIEAPATAVFAAIVDFKSWPQWSPWLMHEPDAAIVYSDGYQHEKRLSQLVHVLFASTEFRMLN